MPYISLARRGYHSHSSVLGVLLAVGVCVPSPLLALTLYLNATLPIPSNLFTNKPEPTGKVQDASRPEKYVRPLSALPASRQCPEIRVRGKSGSYTVVEGRRSGDVWIKNGQAVDGRSRAKRVISLLAPHPKLSVLPPRDEEAAISLPLSDVRSDSSRPRSMQTNAFLDEDVDEIAMAPQRPRGVTDPPSSVDDGYSMECHGPSMDRAQPSALYQGKR
jgi:hypothetical protein